MRSVKQEVLNSIIENYNSYSVNTTTVDLNTHVVNKGYKDLCVKYDVNPNNKSNLRKKYKIFIHDNYSFPFFKLIFNGEELKWKNVEDREHILRVIPLLSLEHILPRSKGGMKGHSFTYLSLNPEELNKVKDNDFPLDYIKENKDKYVVLNTGRYEYVCKVRDVKSFKEVSKKALGDKPDQYLDSIYTKLNRGYKLNETRGYDKKSYNNLHPLFNQIVYITNLYNKDVLYKGDKVIERFYKLLDSDEEIEGENIKEAFKQVFNLKNPKRFFIHNKIIDSYLLKTIEQNDPLRKSINNFIKSYSKKFDLYNEFFFFVENGKIVIKSEYKKLSDRLIEKLNDIKRGIEELEVNTPEVNRVVTDYIYSPNNIKRRDSQLMSYQEIDENYIPFKSVELNLKLNEYNNCLFEKVYNNKKENSYNVLIPKKYFEEKEIGDKKLFKLKESKKYFLGYERTVDDIQYIQYKIEKVSEESISIKVKRVENINEKDLVEDGGNLGKSKGVFKKQNKNKIFYIEDGKVNSVHVEDVYNEIIKNNDDFKNMALKEIFNSELFEKEFKKKYGVEKFYFNEKVVKYNGIEYILSGFQGNKAYFTHHLFCKKINSNFKNNRITDVDKSVKLYEKKISEDGSLNENEISEKVKRFKARLNTDNEIVSTVFDTIMDIEGLVIFEKLDQAEEMFE